MADSIKNDPKTHQPISFKVMSIIVVGLVIGLGIGAIVVHRRAAAPVFPAAVKQAANFSIYYPRAGTPVVVNRSTIIYDNASHGISFDVSLGATRLSISQQATPEIFSESGVYTFKLSQAHQYATLQSDYGDIALTKPTETGQTVAWGNTRGTLILANAHGSLSDSDWRSLFNSLQIIN